MPVSQGLRRAGATSAPAKRTRPNRFKCRVERVDAALVARHLIRPATRGRRLSVSVRSLPERGQGSADSGFTLIEVLVSLVILAIVAAASASMMLSVWQSNSDNRARVAAANLTSRELEIVRSSFASAAQGPQSIPLGQVVNAAPLVPGGPAGAPLVLDNHSYTVTRNTQWESQGATSGACDGGASGQLAYLRVSVIVTWPNMGHTTPVTASTLLTPPLGTYNAGTGHIKAKVLDEDGAPEAGTTITVKNSSGAVVGTQQTASDGCAFFAFLNPGNYTVSASRTGYVDTTWQAAPSQSVTVVANVAAPATFNYANAATTTFVFDTSNAGYFPATTTSLTVFNSLLTSTLHTSSFPSSAPSRTLVTWPYSDGLVPWLGDCTDADPGVTSTVPPSRPPPTATDPGQTISAVVKGAAVTVIVKNAAGVVQPNLQVEAVHANSGCPIPVKDPYDGTTTVGEVLTMPAKTDATGTVRVLLPFGTWTFKVLTKSPSGSWPAILLNSDATYPAPAAVTIP